MFIDTDTDTDSDTDFDFDAELLTFDFWLAFFAVIDFSFTTLAFHHYKLRNACFVQ